MIMEDSYYSPLGSDPFNPLTRYNYNSIEKRNPNPMTESTVETAKRQLGCLQSIIEAHILTLAKKFEENKERYKDLLEPEEDGQSELRTDLQKTDIEVGTKELDKDVEERKENWKMDAVNEKLEHNMYEENQKKVTLHGFYKTLRASIYGEDVFFTANMDEISEQEMRLLNSRSPSDAFLHHDSPNRMWFMKHSRKGTNRICKNVCKKSSVGIKHNAQCRINKELSFSKRSVLKSNYKLAFQRPASHFPGQEVSSIVTPITNLESDGDSLRSISPQSLSAGEDESIIRNGKIMGHNLGDYLSEGAASTSRSSSNESRTSNGSRTSLNESMKPTRPPYIEMMKKEEEARQKASMESVIQRNTLSDHCYHQSRVVEKLNEEEKFSESDEDGDEDEIDVVSYKNETAFIDSAQKQREENLLNFAKNQMKASFAQKQQTENLALRFAQKNDANQLAASQPVRRPRGRPPGPNSAKRKRAEQININETFVVPPPPKRARVQTPCQRGQKRQKSTNQTRTQTASSIDEEKRNLHNDMERMRRISMKNCFDDLKLFVPAIANSDRVAKVNILREAVAYIKELTDKDDNMQQARKEMEKKTDELLERANKLQCRFQR